MRIFVLITGIIGVLLGGFWALQGLGIVHVAPILCAADCAPIEGTSAMWAIIGLVVFAAGIFGVNWSRQIRPGALKG
jgi:hypothetical protein